MQCEGKPLRRFEGGRADPIRRAYWRVKDSLIWATEPKKGQTVRVRFPFGADADLNLKFRNEWLLYRALREGRNYESELTALIVHLLKPGDSFIDGGANSGWYALLAASRVGPSGHVWAIEPSPRPWDRLVHNLALNPALSSVVTPIRAALTSTGGDTVRIYQHPDHDASNSLDRPGQGDAVEVPTVRLGDLGAPPHSVIKLDIEGHEYAAWDGWDHSIPASWLIEWEPLLPDSLRKLAERLRGHEVSAILPDGSGYRLEGIHDQWPLDHVNLYLPDR